MKAAFIILAILFLASVAVIALLAVRLHRAEAASEAVPEEKDAAVEGHDPQEHASHLADYAELVNYAKQLYSPLSLIKGPLDDILSSDNLDSAVRSKLLFIEDGADRMLELYGEIFKPEVGDVSVDFAPSVFSTGMNIRADRMNEEVVDGKPGKPVVMVVEKDFSMRLFLVSLLKESYSTLSVPDSFEAQRVLERYDVNLILCNADLDQVDGIELCKIIKEDMRHSHIPIVIYFPAGSNESRLKAISVGADLCVETPTSSAYMLAVVQNLLSIREKLRYKYASSPWLGVSAMALSKTDESFLTQLNALVQENMDDPSFSVDDLAETMNMSRSTLYRKIMSLTNMSPNGFLNCERLKKAALLLKEGSDKINEVSYKVGFSSSSYFTKCFQKQFGVLPKDYK